jgi:hypothetical protein
MGNLEFMLAPRALKLHFFFTKPLMKPKYFYACCIFLGSQG